MHQDREWNWWEKSGASLLDRDQTLRKKKNKNKPPFEQHFLRVKGWMDKINKGTKLGELETVPKTRCACKGGCVQSRKTREEPQPALPCPTRTPGPCRAVPGSTVPTSSRARGIWGRFGGTGCLLHRQGGGTGIGERPHAESFGFFLILVVFFFLL